MSSATIWFSCCVSSGPPRRLRRVRPVGVVLPAPGFRPRRRRAGASEPCAVSSGVMATPAYRSWPEKPSLRGHEHLLSRKTLESFACKFVCRIRFTTHITDDAPATPASLSNFMNCDAKTVAGRHSTANDRCAVRAHDHAVIRPARGGEIEGARAHVRLELSRPS